MLWSLAAGACGEGLPTAPTVPTSVAPFIVSSPTPYAGSDAPDFWGVWIGTIAGVTTATLIAFSGPIFGVNPVTGLDPVSFQWIAPTSVVVDITVGVIACRLFPRRKVIT
ncbi:MAG: hypothetical protein HC814_02000 [Rhodobacteraceae bacterium]|nr:hypothetical protein [Paracoccaceae bacterium]